jgi:hypothetical protein
MAGAPRPRRRYGVVIPLAQTIARTTMATPPCEMAAGYVRPVRTPLKGIRAPDHGIIPGLVGDAGRSVTTLKAELTAGVL